MTDRIRRAGRWLESLGRFSAVARLARENLEKQQVGLIPAQSFGASETVVGRPVCTPADAERGLRPTSSVVSKRSSRIVNGSAACRS